MKNLRLKALLLALAFPAAHAAVPTISGCQVFPADNVWNTPVDKLPVHKLSDGWVKNWGYGSLVPDFGSGAYFNNSMIGIPVNVIKASLYPKANFIFDYAAESDKLAYPLDSTFLIEPSSDHHLISIDTETCTLYELFDVNGEKKTAGSGAVFKLNSNAMRPSGWTSADAAGLAILPGLVQQEEVAKGAIDHALRITGTTWSNIWPATHKTDGMPYTPVAARPPMGARMRLKATVDIANFPKTAQVILTALKKYGAIVADNGGRWFISGSPSAAWNNDILSTLRKITGDMFEYVDESCLMVAENSYQADLSKCNGKPPATDATYSPTTAELFLPRIAVDKTVYSATLTLDNRECFMRISPTQIQSLGANACWRITKQPTVVAN